MKTPFVYCISAFLYIWKQKIEGCSVRSLLKELIAAFTPSGMIVEHLEGTLLLLPFTRLHHQLKLVNRFRRCLYCWCLIPFLHKKAYDDDFRREIWPSGVHRTFVIFSAKVRKNNDSQNKKQWRGCIRMSSNGLWLGLYLTHLMGNGHFPSLCQQNHLMFHPRFFPSNSPRFFRLSVPSIRGRLAFDSTSTRLRLFNYSFNKFSLPSPCFLPHQRGIQRIDFPIFGIFYPQNATFFHYVKYSLYLCTRNFEDTDGGLSV